MSVKSAIINSVAEELSRIAKGTALTHDFLAERLGEIKGSHSYYGKINSLRNKLENEYSIFLETNWEKGYTLLEADLSWKHVDGCIEKSKKRLRRHYNRITKLPINDMSENARNEALLGMQRHSALIIMLNAGSKTKALT